MSHVCCTHKQEHVKLLVRKKYVQKQKVGVTGAIKAAGKFLFWKCYTNIYVYTHIYLHICVTGAIKAAARFCSRSVCLRIFIYMTIFIYMRIFMYILLSYVYVCICTLLLLYHCVFIQYITFIYYIYCSLRTGKCCIY